MLKTDSLQIVQKSLRRMTPNWECQYSRQNSSRNNFMADSQMSLLIHCQILMTRHPKWNLHSAHVWLFHTKALLIALLMLARFWSQGVEMLVHSKLGRTVWLGTLWQWWHCWPGGAFGSSADIYLLQQIVHLAQDHKSVLHICLLLRIKCSE